MKFKYILTAFMLLFLASCDGDPASSGNAKYNPDIHKLGSIDFQGAKVLALSPQPETAAGFSISSKPSCDELGKLKGAIYEKLPTQDKNGNPYTPCFKQIGYWKHGSAYGRYAPADSTEDVWFVTDPEGNVHHLPGTPYKSQGFKNGKRIKMFKGKPVYLNEWGELASFDMSLDAEEIVIDSALTRFVILDREDGEHLVYQDTHGAGKRLKPNDLTEALGSINNTSVFYANGSQDLEYSSNMYLKRVVLDATGNIVADASTVVPEAYAEWLGNSLGKPMPTGPIFTGNMEDFEKLDEFLIGNGKGYILADSTQDMQEVSWCDFGHCGWLDGWGGTASCIDSEYIYFYSHRVSDPKLTRIARDLQSSEDILTNIEIEQLVCTDSGILIKGRNIDTSSDEAFHFQDNVKTFLTAPISEFSQ